MREKRVYKSRANYVIPQHDVADAALFLRTALADGAHHADEVIDDARVYQIGYGAVSQAAEDMGVIEFWDATAEKICWALREEYKPWKS